MDDSNELLNLESIEQQLTLDGNLSDEEESSAADVIKLIEEAWHNEKFAPEILPHKNELVSCLLELISSMEENLEALPYNDIRKGIHQMELERLKYLVSSYLRHRLEKIELFVFAILQEEENRMEKGEELYLTEGEMQFAREYKESVDQYFEKMLKFWPGLPPDDWKKEKVTPNMRSFVFVKAKKEIAGVMLDDANDSDVIDFAENSQVLISYSNIANFVRCGDIHLI